jgi:hypothetical protein
MTCIFLLSFAKAKPFYIFTTGFMFFKKKKTDIFKKVITPLVNTVKNINAKAYYLGTIKDSSETPTYHNSTCSRQCAVKVLTIWNNQKYAPSKNLHLLKQMSLYLLIT